MFMRNRIPIYIILLITFFSCLSKKDENKQNLPLQNQQLIRVENDCVLSKISSASIVSGIVKQVEMLDAFDYKDSTYLENEDFVDQLPDGGASLHGFFIKDQLVKMKEWIGLSYAIIERTYYFNQGDPIYVLETEDALNLEEKSTSNSNLNANHSERQFYFHQQSLLKTIATGQPIMQGNESVEKDLFLSVERNRKLLVLHRKGKALTN